MDEKAFKMINAGASAYFLMMYCCLMSLLGLWFSASGYALVSMGVCLLMFLSGVLLYKRYREALTRDSDAGNAAASAAVKLLGSSIILVIILQLVIRQFYLSIGQYSQKVLLWNLVFLLYYSPFIIIAVINIRKGLKIKAGHTLSDSIGFIWCRVLTLVLFFTGLNDLMVWFQTMLTISDYSITPFDLRWISVPLGSCAIAVILYFASSRMNNIRIDNSSYKYLSSQSCVTGGYLLLLIGLFKILDQLAPVFAQLISEFRTFTDEPFNSFSLRSFAGFAPALLLLMISLLMIIYGKKRESALKQSL